MIDNTKPFFVTNCISLHPDELYIYGRIDWIDGMKKVSEKSKLNLQDNHTHNKLSDKAKKKAKRAIKYLIYNSAEKTAYNHKLGTTFKFKVNFITLTLSSTQIHSDQEIKSILLNQFLTEAKQKWGLQHYIWKSERQKNGNIHFHILSDVWIPWLELRNTWNRIQNKLGYIDRYSGINKQNQRNSTDVHSLKKVDNVPAYIIKYMTKEHGFNHIQIKNGTNGYYKKIVIDLKSVSLGAKKFLSDLSNCGRIWTCSRSLSNITGSRSELSEEIEEEINRLQKEKGVRRFDKEYITGIYFSNNILNNGNYPNLQSLLFDYTSKLFIKTDQLILNTT